MYKPCPAVSQICNFKGLPSTSMTFVPNSTPMVCGESGKTKKERRKKKRDRERENTHTYDRIVIYSTLCSTLKKKTNISYQ